jgi:phytanoyl-CoA hydroxylase
MNYAYIENHVISPENIAFYQDFGYLVAENLLAASEIVELKRETAYIFKGGRGNVEGLVPVDGNESDVDVLKKYVAIHFPHKISPVIHKFLFHEKVVSILTRIVSPNAKCMQSMLFVKAPGKKGQAWHQDEYYIPTRDRSLVGAWMAIDDANIDNGCLWIIPGSNKPGYIMPRIANDSPEYADMDTIDVAPYKDQAMPVEVKAGSVVFFNGYILHSSLSNKTTDHFRMALVNHYMSAESMLPWDQDGKLRLMHDLRDIVLVAGKDPYAYKGITNVTQPYLRPEVMKGKKEPH